MSVVARLAQNEALEIRQAVDDGVRVEVLQIAANEAEVNEQSKRSERVGREACAECSQEHQILVE